MVQQKRQSQDKQQQQLDQLASCWSDVVASYQKAYDFFLFLYFYLKSRISTWSLELETWNSEPPNNSPVAILKAPKQVSCLL